MKGFDIVPYSDNDFLEFRNHIERAFHSTYILTDCRYIRWQFDEILVVKVEGKIVGHCGYKDFAYKVHTMTQTLRVMMNLQIEDAYRAFGIGTLLVQKILDTAHPILIASFRESTNKLLSHLRPLWQEVGYLRRYMAIFQPSHVFFEGFSIPAIVVHNEEGKKRRIEEITIEEVKHIDCAYDTFWHNARARFGITVERTSAYLAWRFIDHPFFSYTIYGAYSEHKLAGYAVWRYETCDDFIIARLIDFIAETNVEDALLGAFFEDARLKGAHAADFFCSGSLYHESLIDVGFFDVEGTDLMQFSLHFNPISQGRRVINIGNDFKASLADCYLTKEIADVDRPNPH